MSNFNPIFQSIDQLHSEWSMIDKTAKLIWLKQRQKEFYALAEQMAMRIRLRGGRMTDEEKAESKKLLGMIDAVNAEGIKTTNEIKSDILKELMKGIMS